MSGTDYTLTTNLGLYKPLPTADIDAWGGHLNSNADMLDTALHSVQTAGPFLPLAGGTVTGMANFNAGTTHGASGNNIVTIAPASTTAATSWLTTPGSIGIGSSSATSGFGVNLGYGPGSFGTVASATLLTGGNAGDGTTGNTFTVNNILKSQFYRALGNTYTGSGGAGTSIMGLTASYTGTFSSGPFLLQVQIPTDTVASDGVPHFPNTLSVIHNFGGGATSGGRIAGSFSLNQIGSAATTGAQYVVLQPWFTSGSASGGTSSASTGGYAYSLNPQVILNPGAAFFALANALGEINIKVVGTQQTCTIAGSATAGDVISLTFTNGAITGSPVTVAYTVGTAQSLPSIAYAVQAAVLANVALRSAGVSATVTNGTGALQLCWPLEIGTVTVAQSVSGAATETVTLGSVVPGASADQKYGMSIIREGGDTGPPMTNSIAIEIHDQPNAPPVAGWRAILGVGGGIGQWPLAQQGTIINAGLSNTAGGYNRSQQIPPMLATSGIDFHYVNFTQQSGHALVLPGYTLDGAGNSFYGPAKIGMGASGLTIDSVGWTGSGNASVVTGGGGGSGVSIGNYYAGDLVYDDLGGQHVVAGVNPATGAVTSLTTVVQPSGPAGSAPAGTRPTTGGTGINLTLGVTWVAATGLSLNPTGQRIGFNGTTPVTKPTVSGAKGSNAALASLLAALAGYGLITDTTTA